MTAEEYMAISAEGDRTQLVEGLVIVNEPKLRHGVLQLRLGMALGAWTESDAGFGVASMPTSVKLDEHNVFGPDLVWIAEDHALSELDRYPETVPDLCVEVRSSSTWRYDTGAKRAVYERSGLPELWLVDDAAERVLVFRRSRRDSRMFDVTLELRAGEELASPQLPGFALAIERLFRDS
jgi:Uma2 family endonuclease